jgi:hypothetical protein
MKGVDKADGRDAGEEEDEGEWELKKNFQMLCG